MFERALRISIRGGRSTWETRVTTLAQDDQCEARFHKVFSALPMFYWVQTHEGQLNTWLLFDLQSDGGVVVDLLLPRRDLQRLPDATERHRDMLRGSDVAVLHIIAYYQHGPLVDNCLTSLTCTDNDAVIASSGRAPALQGLIKSLQHIATRALGLPRNTSLEVRKNKLLADLASEIEYWQEETEPAVSLATRHTTHRPDRRRAASGITVRHKVWTLALSLHARLTCVALQLPVTPYRSLRRMRRK